MCFSPGGGKHPLHLISSSEQQDSDLLRVEFIKVSTNPLTRLKGEGLSDQGVICE